jgi:hypothetical protein
VAHTAFVFSGLFSVWQSQGGAQVRVRTGVKKSDIRAAKGDVRFTPESDIKCDICNVGYGPKADILIDRLWPKEEPQPTKKNVPFCDALNIEP